MITTGSVRGKCSALQLEHSRFQPPSFIEVRAPQLAHPHDWMTSDAEVACPDPNCPSRLRITRIGKRSFSHADTTAVPLPQEKK
jgi:hypothetical protein